MADMFAAMVAASRPAMGPGQDGPGPTQASMTRSNSAGDLDQSDQFTQFDHFYPHGPAGRHGPSAACLEGMGPDTEFDQWEFDQIDHCPESDHHGGPLDDRQELGNFNGWGFCGTSPIRPLLSPCGRVTIQTAGQNAGRTLTSPVQFGAIVSPVRQRQMSPFRPPVGRRQGGPCQPASGPRLACVAGLACGGH